jgi:hypothetical protein
MKNNENFPMTNLKAQITQKRKKRIETKKNTYGRKAGLKKIPS